MKVPKVPKGHSMKGHRRVTPEETKEDNYIYTELLKLGYDIYAFDANKSNKYDNRKYMKCTAIAQDCIKKRIEIPKDVKEYLLFVKAINESEDK